MHSNYIDIINSDNDIVRLSTTADLPDPFQMRKP